MSREPRLRQRLHYLLRDIIRIEHTNAPPNSDMQDDRRNKCHLWSVSVILHNYEIQSRSIPFLAFTCRAYNTRTPDAITGASHAIAIPQNPRAPKSLPKRILLAWDIAFDYTFANHALFSFQVQLLVPRIEDSLRHVGRRGWYQTPCPILSL